jgi:hyperosmotically inducible protein
MKSRIVGIFLIAGALMLPAAAFSADSDSDRSNPERFVKDSAITAKIKAKLAEEKASSLLHISVDTDRKGAVVLTGTVRTQAGRERAVAIARGVEGVTSVKDEIRIKADD